MQAIDNVVSIHCSDIHLSHTKPLAREEVDWYPVMERQLNELCNLQRKYQCPVFISGDVFHKWNSPPELITFAMRNMPTDTWVVAGQHDLPYHKFSDLHKSALGTLIESDAVKLLEKPVRYGDYVYFGYNWLDEIGKGMKKPEGVKCVAIVHAYVWKQGCGFKDAPQERHFVSYGDKLEHFTCAFFGDNHIPFQAGKLINCGAFMPRRLDERIIQPSVWLLCQSGAVVRMYLPTANDKWSDIRDLGNDLQEAFDAALFVKMLKQMTGGSGFDFEKMVRDCIDHGDFTSDVKDELWTALGIPNE